jgi:hypothetical protein
MIRHANNGALPYHALRLAGCVMELGGLHHLHLSTAEDGNDVLQDGNEMRHVVCFKVLRKKTEICINLLSLESTCLRLPFDAVMRLHELK